MKKLLLASVAVGAMSFGAANAADLRMPVKAAPLPPAFSWTGCYVGGHWGWGWAESKGVGTSFSRLTSSGTFKNQISGPIFGGQLGCNYQWPGSNFVVGVEGSYSAANIIGATDGNTAFFADDSQFVHSKIDGLASVTGRIGWNGWDPMVLFYVKGGWAWAHERILFGRTSEFNARSDTRNGWVIGGGIEWALSFAPRWSALVEYQHYDFRNKSLLITSCCSGAISRMKLNVDTVKIGVNYKLFGP
jgi:outer membrane immunogenic protein